MVVEMMDIKKILVYAIVYILCITVLAASIIQACEEQEENEICDSMREDDISDTKDLSQSTGLFDTLLERYPLLNQIIEMILDLLYNWLSNLQYGTSL